MVHDLSPFIFKFPDTSLWGDHFGIRWYGFSYMLGFICAYKIISWLAERQRAGLNYTMVGDFITYAAIGTLVGGRLGYCLFYDPSLFLSFRPSIPFWGVLAVNEGGMASHGGIIGIIVASILYAKKHGLKTVIECYIHFLPIGCKFALNLDGLPKKNRNIKIKFKL